MNLYFILEKIDILVQKKWAATFDASPSLTRPAPVFCNPWFPVIKPRAPRPRPVATLVAPWLKN